MIFKAKKPGLALQIESSKKRHQTKDYNHTYVEYQWGRHGEFHSTNSSNRASVEAVHLAKVRIQEFIPTLEFWG
jgi:hypothetical protein